MQIHSGFMLKLKLMELVLACVKWQATLQEIFAIPPTGPNSFESESLVKTKKISAVGAKASP